MLASLQRFITLGMAAALLCWILALHAYAPVWAAVGAFVLLTGHAWVLGLEFLLQRRINRDDPTPRATVGETLQAWWAESRMAPGVFCWRQPFRAQAVADHLPDSFASPSGDARRGVVLVHGFFCNRGFWTPWLLRLRAGGRPFIAVTLEPVFGSIDGYAPQIDRAVADLTRRTGQAPLVVAHSMGGLAVRAWLARPGRTGDAWWVVTIGTPHRGTWLACFGDGENGRQMRLGSDWHGQLDQLDRQAGPARFARFTCWYSNCDNIVFPASTATLPGADNRLVRGAAHVELAFVAEVMDSTLALLDAASSAARGPDALLS